jgi:hypothetical protein
MFRPSRFGRAFLITGGNMDKPPVDRSKYPFTPGYYKHYKGKVYNATGVALHSESWEPLVIYNDPHDMIDIWGRPYDMFLDKIESVGSGKMPRFAYVGPAPLHINERTQKLENCILWVLGYASGVGQTGQRIKQVIKQLLGDDPSFAVFCSRE